MRVQLGVVDVWAAVEGGRVLAVEIAGDLLAPSAAVAALEAGLRGCATEPDAITRVVAESFAPPAFLLGVEQRALVDAVVRAVTADALRPARLSAPQVCGPAIAELVTAGAATPEELEALARASGTRARRSSGRPQRRSAPLQPAAWS